VSGCRTTAKDTKWWPSCTVDRARDGLCGGMRKRACGEKLMDASLAYGASMKLSVSCHSTPLGHP